MDYCEKKTLASYLIVTAIVDLCSFFYIAGYITLFLIQITGFSSDGYRLAVGLANLVMYLLFITVFIYFLRKIVRCNNHSIKTTFYLWSIFILAEPVISRLVLKALTQAAMQTQTVSISADRAGGWAVYAMIICFYVLCAVLTSCYMRQIRYVVLAALLSIIYFHGWYASLINQSEVIDLHNFVKLGFIALTGLLILLPAKSHQKKD